MNAIVKKILSPFWRKLLRLQRLWRSIDKLSLFSFVWLIFIDLVLNPVFQMLKIHGQQVKISVRGYAGHFVIRIASTDTECFLEVILEDEYETAIRLAGSQPELIFDAGSNAGYSLRYFQNAFPSAVIIGVEPDDKNFALCQKNVSRGENPERVKLFSCCVAAYPARVQLEKGRGEWAMRMKPTSPEDSGNLIAAKTVDQILQEAGMGEHHIDLFKCDIEGAEAELFQKPGLWLKRTTNLAVETHEPYYDVCLRDDLQRFANDFEFFFENEMVFACRSTEI